MKEVAFFYRRKNPAYFSIEQVFERISTGLSAAYSAEFGVSQYQMPLPSKLQHLLPNMRFTRRQSADINHVTGDVHYALLACSRKKVNILTVHDCVLLHRLRRTDPRYWVIKWLWYTLPVRKADVITVVSEMTKKDLLHFTGCDPEKIRVIPNFTDPVFRPSPLPPPAERSRILFVGTTVNKNLHRLAAAMEGLPAELDIIGRLQEDQIEVLKEHKIIYRQSSGLSREELLKHYHDCHVLAFPSVFEGFGLPLIEAQATGRPVLTSDLSPMREIAGGAACLVDPYDIASIRSGLVRLLQDDGYREELVTAGLLNAGKYRLENVIRQYADLYRELLQRKRTS